MRGFTLLALLCVGLGVGLWWLSSRSGPTPAAALTQQAGEPAHGGSNTVRPRAADAAATRTTLAGERPAVDVEPAAGLRAVAILVTDQSGAAIPGAHVEVGSRADMGSLALDYVADSYGGQCDENGRLALDLPTLRPFEVRVGADGFAVQVWRDQVARAEWRFELPPGGNITGVVVDARDGAPIPDAAVTSGWAQATTDAEGRFELARLACAVNTVYVRAPGRLLGRARLEEPLPPGGSLELRVELEPGEAVSGFVVDDVTSEPIQGAEVWVKHGAASVRTDALGRYVLGGVSPHAELRVAASGYVQASRRYSPDPALLPFDPDFRLTRGFGVAGSVVGPAGALLAGARVRAFCRDNGRRALIDSLETDAGGKFEIAGLDPRRRNHLVVDAPGCATLAFGLPRPADGAEWLDVGPLQLAPPGSLQGRVVDRFGGGVPGAQVQVAGPADMEELGWTAVDRSTVADDDGRFAFEGLAPADYTVRASYRGVSESVRSDRVKGRLTSESRPRVRIESATRAETVVELPLGARIAGHVSGWSETCEVVAIAEDGIHAGRVEAKVQCRGPFEFLTLEGTRYTLVANSNWSSFGAWTEESGPYHAGRVNGVLLGRLDVDLPMEPTPTAEVRVGSDNEKAGVESLGPDFSHLTGFQPRVYVAAGPYNLWYVQGTGTLRIPVLPHGPSVVHAESGSRVHSSRAHQHTRPGNAEKRSADTEVFAGDSGTELVLEKVGN